MGSMDFVIEFNIEVEPVNEEFTVEADQRLRELVGDRTDIVGASVALEEIVKVESPYLYQVRIVIYKRPNYIAVVEKAPEPIIALRNALNALERKVYASREELKESEFRNADDVTNVNLDLTPRELFDTYIEGDTIGSELLEEGRTKIASRLMVEHGLSQEAAYFAADKILEFATEETGNIST